MQAHGGFIESFFVPMYAVQMLVLWAQGKTFIVANVIQKTSLPTLVLAPNKVNTTVVLFPVSCLFSLPVGEWLGRDVYR